MSSANWIPRKFNEGECEIIIGKSGNWFPTSLALTVNLRFPQKKKSKCPSKHSKNPQDSLNKSVVISIPVKTGQAKLLNFNFKLFLARIT